MKGERRGNEQENEKKTRESPRSHPMQAAVLAYQVYRQLSNVRCRLRTGAKSRMDGPSASMANGKHQGQSACIGLCTAVSLQPIIFGYLGPSRRVGTAYGLDCALCWQ